MNRAELYLSANIAVSLSSGVATWQARQSRRGDGHSSRRHKGRQAAYDAVWQWSRMVC